MKDMKKRVCLFILIFMLGGFTGGNFISMGNASICGSGECSAGG